MKEKYLFVFSVGPVQSFIASARKTEDFWSGSYILSYLVREAIKQLYEKSGFQLIYPVMTKEEIDHPNKDRIHIASVPNRFTAILEGTKEEMKSSLKACEKHVKESFCEIISEAINHVFENSKDEQRERIKQTAREQVEGFLEIYWAAEPYDPDLSFDSIREKVEKQLGAIKNEKNYPQMEQNGFSCSVCSERDALCIEEICEYDRYGEIKRKLDRTWEHLKKIQTFDVDEKENEGEEKNEYLCGVCLGKRYARKYFRKKFNQDSNENDNFQRFESVVKHTGANHKYYAIFMMDGDNMGKWLKGDHISDYSKTSIKLTRFARDTVPSIVEKKDCQLIYAGGDDVLAFMSIDEAFEIARQLRMAFSNEKQGLGEGATASAGLIIAHTKSPLQIVLNEVRRLEKKAKSYVNPRTGEEKNALAIAVHTRSGEVSESVLPWELNAHSTIDLLQKTKYLLNEQLSATFIFRFAEAFLPLLPRDFGRNDSKYKKIKNNDMLKVELKRLIKRSRKKDELNETTIHELTEQLVELHQSMETTMDFIYLLKILTFLERKEEKENDESASNAG